MFREMRVGRTEACISDLRLDAWLARELDDEQVRELRDHLSGCARCRSRKAALQQERSRFEAVRPAPPTWFETAGLPLEAPRRRPGWLLGSACMAAAGLLALLTLTREGVRTKGGDYVSFYVKRGDEVHRGQPRERVRRGDKLRFAYTASGPRYLAILGLDGTRRASVYYPAAVQTVRVEAGTDVLLPSAIELDGAPGDERILALFCERPLPVERLRAELQAKQAHMAAPSGCVLDQLFVVKEAATP